MVEDGPSLTHGGLPFGAGVIAARKWGAAEMIDPRPFATGSIKKVYEQYPHTGKVLPAMGYTDAQIRELETTINQARAELVLLATPIELTRLLKIDRPTLRVRYEYRDHGQPRLEDVLIELIGRLGGTL